MKMSGLGEYGPFMSANVGQSLRTLNGLGDTTITTPNTDHSVASPVYDFLWRYAPTIAARIPAPLVTPLTVVGGISLSPLDLLTTYFIYRIVR